MLLFFSTVKNSTFLKSIVYTSNKFIVLRKTQKFNIKIDEIYSVKADERNKKVKKIYVYYLKIKHQRQWLLEKE